MAFQNDGLRDSGILYGVVARGSCILASHCAKVGNFNEVAKDLLIKIDQQTRTASSPVPSKMTYKDGNYLYHYARGEHQGVLFLCMTDDKFPRQEAFKFMDSLAKKLKEQFPLQVQSYPKTIPFCLNSEFEPVIGAEIKRANRDAMNYPQTMGETSSESEKSDNEDDSALLGPTSSTSGKSSRMNGNSKSRRGKTTVRPGDPDKVERVRDEVARVKDIMVTNIEALLERGERLDLIVDKAEQLSSNAVAFKQASRTLARRMWWQNFKVWIWITIAVLVVIYIIISAACGGPSWPKCVGKGGHGNGTHNL